MNAETKPATPTQVPRALVGKHRRYRNVIHPVRALRSSPAYAVAGFCHLLLLVVLSFWTVAVHLQREVESVDVKLVRTKKVVPVTAGMEKEQAALSALMDANTRDLQALQESATDDPFQESRGDAAGKVNVFGAGGGGSSGVGRGGNRDGRGGSSKASDGALKGGLDWLARHQTKRGGWRILGPNHGQGKCTVRPGAENVGRTGLALLGFLCANKGPTSKSRFRKHAFRAQQWLLSQVRGSGRLKTTTGWSYNYGHAIATLALAECLARDKRNKRLREAVQRMVGYILRVQSTRYGWRYSLDESDTSVTCWMVLALRSAQHAGVPVPEKSYDNVRAFLKQVSRQNGFTGYMIKEPRGSMAMDATGLFMRVMLGEKPNTTMNRNAARRVARARLAIQRSTGSVTNLYGVYYAALAMYQVGGQAWRAFNVRIRDGVVAIQHKGTSCLRGSWKGTPHFGKTPDRVLATCFGTLILETYYRYLPVHGGLQGSGQGIDLRELSEGEDLLEQAGVALQNASKTRDRGALLAAEAAYQRALRALRQEKAKWPLEGKARTGLIQLAILSQDSPRVLQRIEAYVQALPKGATASPTVMRLRRVERFQRALKAARTGLQAKQPSKRKAALQALAAFEAHLKAELPRLSKWGAQKEEAQTMLGQVQVLRSRIVFADDPVQGIQTMTTLVEKSPAKGKPTIVERRLLVALLLRAHQLFNEASEQRKRRPLDEGEIALRRIARRRMIARLPQADRGRVQPLFERAQLTHAAALTRLGRHRAAHIAARRFAQKFPNSALRPQAEAIERAALSQRVQGGSATKRERAQLNRLLVQYAKRNPRLPGAEALALAELLLAAGNRQAAKRRFLSVATGADAKLRSSGQLGLARVERVSGNAKRALVLLAEIEGDDRGRLDVLLERCLAWRALAQPRKALEEYLEMLRALENHPRAWWNVAEQTALTYVEARQVKAARAFLEGLRVKDVRFGGRERQRQRFLSLMRQVDVMKD